MLKITIVILALLLLPSIGSAQEKTIEEGSDTMAHEHNNEALEIIADGIRAKMCDDIFEEFKRLVKKQIEPWGFFNTSKGVHVKKFDGKNISMSGGKYNDQSKTAFFNYIEPFIEDVIKRRIDETIELAKDRKVPLSSVLGSTKANLSGGINTVYHKMQEIDRRLRGGGHPESVPKRDISREIKKMNDFLDRQMKIAKNLYFEIPEAEHGKDVEGKQDGMIVTHKPWYKKVWAILLAVGILLGILWTAIQIYESKTYNNLFPMSEEKIQTPLDEKINSNIFADVSKDGTKSRSNEFPWEIRKSKNEEGNVLYTMVGRGGDKTAISVVPDNPKPEICPSYDGMVIKYTCAEKEIPDFTIKVKY